MDFQCYIKLCPCVYGLQQNGFLTNSCPFCSLFAFVQVKKDVTPVFS